MKLRLRPFQATANGRVRELFRAGVRKIVLVSPTGSGKTVMSADIIEGAVAKGNRVVFLAHRKELIDQASRTLDAIGVDHGVIKSGHYRKRPHLPVQVASVQTLAARRRCPVCGGVASAGVLGPVPVEPCENCSGTGKIAKKMPEASVVVVDECHRSLSPTHLSLIEAFLEQNSDALILGLTATPWRLDGRGLSDVYETLVLTIEVQELIEQGFLLPLRVFAPDKPDLQRVAKTRIGDYDLGELSLVMRQDKLVGNIVQKWLELGEQRQTVVFATSCEHSQDIVRRFVEAGVKAEHLDGQTPEPEREAILTRLATKQTRIVSNVDVLVEGYDLPDLGCVVLARPTESLTRYLQQVGRCMRPAEGQTYAVVIDHAGCVHTHGLPTDPRRWTLDARRKKGNGASEGEMSITVVCEQCGALRRAEAGFCPVCSGIQVAVFRGLPTEEDGELVEYKATYPCASCQSANVKVASWNEVEVVVNCRDCGAKNYEVDRFAASQASELLKKKEWRRLEHVRLSRGFKDGWTAHQFKRLFGAFPPRDWTLDATRTPAPTKSKSKNYGLF